MTSEYLKTLESNLQELKGKAKLVSDLRNNYDRKLQALETCLKEGLTIDIKQYELVNYKLRCYQNDVDYFIELIHEVKQDIKEEIEYIKIMEK